MRFAEILLYHSKKIVKTVYKKGLSSAGADKGNIWGSCACGDKGIEFSMQSEDVIGN